MIGLEQDNAKSLIVKKINNVASVLLAFLLGRQAALFGQPPGASTKLFYKEIAMKRSLLFAALAAALASAGAAHAAATQVNFGISPSGTFGYAGASLGTSTSIDFGSSTFSVNTIGEAPPFTDDSGAFLGMAVFFSQSVFNYSIGSTTAVDFSKTFETGAGGAAGSQGSYTATFTSVTAGSAGADFVNMTFMGMVTGPNGFSAVDVMLLNCNQSGGSGLSVNCSFTQQGPPFPTQLPEPATLGLVGLALFGLAAARRRTR